MNYSFALVLFGLIVTHFLLHVGLGFGNAAPDLLALALLIGSRALPVSWAAALGFTLGVLEDSFTAASFGASVLALTLLGAGGAWSRRFFSARSVVFLTAYLFAGKWLRDAVAWGVSNPVSRPALDDHLLFESPLMALYVALAGLLVRLLFLRQAKL